MDQINYHQIIRSFIKPEHHQTAKQQAETVGKAGKGKNGGFADLSGRGAAGQTNKLGARAGAKGSNTLLRGGIPGSNNAKGKPLRQPARQTTAEANSGKQAG